MTSSIGASIFLSSDTYTPAPSQLAIFSGPNAANAAVSAPLHLSDSNDDNPSVFATVLDLLRTAEDDDTAVLAYYVSAMAIIFPNLKEHARNSLEKRGLCVYEVLLPSGARTDLIAMEVAYSTPEIWVYAGQLMIVPFKNINLASFASYMAKRSNALCAYAGLATIPVVVELNIATRIRRVVGADNAFRKQLLNSILSCRSSLPDEISGQICGYVSNILEHTEMSAIVVIYQTLVLALSPVLSDPAVAAEVIAFGEAVRAVANSPHPPYFKILESPSSTRLVERGRFPILFEVARRIKARTQPSVSNLIGSNLGASSEMTRLLDLHSAAQTSSIHPAVQEQINYLGLVDNQFLFS